jgi:signal transduction protein with GAF and PtsI domain
MTSPDRQAPLWLIWALIAAFGAIEAAAWLIAGGVPRRPVVLVQVIAAWIVMLILAGLATRRIGTLTGRIREHENAHRSTLNEIEQLQTQNAMLELVARSVDVPLAFQALATRIARIVPCDRVGLALLNETGDEFQTYTARVHEEERRTRPRPEVVFRMERTVLGSVVRSREPMIISNVAETAGDFLDANVLHTSGFASVLMVPLVSKGRAVGTLNLVSRTRNAFVPEHAAAIQPIAEIFAVAVVAQQLQMLLGRYRTMEAMAELTISVSSEINSALQTIIGHCDLLERGYPDPNLQRDLATVVRQAQRIAGLLEKMRVAANDRLKEVEAVVSDAGIPSSPEEFGGGVVKTTENL